MATKLDEPLDVRGKKTRWLYEGENFDVRYFDPAEKPQTEQIELLGRILSITPEALKHLAGRTLTLRRVNSDYGLINVPRYVLVADSAPDVSFETSDRIKNNFSIAALTILGGFTGMGVIWLLICLFARLLEPWLKISGDKFLSLIMPSFIVGWIISAIISFFFFRSIYKTKGRTKFTQEEVQRKYLGQVGLGPDLNWWTYLGIPTPLTIVLVIFFEHFAHTAGQETAAAFLAFMIVGVPAMYFCDRIKRRIVIRLGLLGWTLTIIGLYWYFKTYGP